MPAPPYNNLLTRLRVGFRVPRMNLSRVTPTIDASVRPPTVFEPSVPAGARILHCVVLMCAPEFSTSGRTLITNYDQCVWWSQIIEPAEGRFDLGDTNHRFRLRDSDFACDRFYDEPPATATEYGPFVACWAYDNTHVIAASDLVPITPGELEVECREKIARSCSARRAEDGRYGLALCERPEGQLGTCAEGDAGATCLRRCLWDVDCPQPMRREGARLGGGPGIDAGAEPPQQCIFPRGYDELGVCVPAGREP